MKAWGIGPRWIAAIPSLRTGELVPGFARALAERLGVAFAAVLERVTDRPPQREMANSHQQVANVRGGFAVTEAPPAGPGCWLTTSASPAGPSRWSPASCAARAPRRSFRSP